jgi:hypothetical protein
MQLDLGGGVRMRVFVGFAVSLALVLAFASVAMAGPRSDQYNNQVAQTTSKPKPVAGVSGATATQKAPSVSKAATGALPFTGMQLGFAVLAGAGLVCAGLFFRRMGRPESKDS